MQFQFEKHARGEAHVGPDAGVLIKPVFGLMGWRRPRLGGRAPARRAACFETARSRLASSRISYLFSVQCGPVNKRQLLKPSFARPGRRGVCPYAKLKAAFCPTIEHGCVLRAAPDEPLS